MAISESTVDTEEMAIDEINAPVALVTARNTKSNTSSDGAGWPTFAEKSKKLIDQDQVPVVFGGWTSASRKAMPYLRVKEPSLLPDSVRGSGVFQKHLLHRCHPNQVGACHQVHV